MKTILKNPITWIIALGIMLAISIEQNLNLGEKVNGLEAGQKLINEKFEEQKKENFNLIEKIESFDRSKETEMILTEVKDLKRTIKNIPRYDKSIDNITDPDSISRLFTRHYPNNR